MLSSGYFRIAPMAELDEVIIKSLVSFNLQPATTAAATATATYIQMVYSGNLVSIDLNGT